MTNIINHDLRSVDGRTVYMPPYVGGETGWGNLAMPNILAVDTVQKYPIGTKYVDGDRIFKYGLSSGNLTALYGAFTYMPITEEGVLTADVATGATTLGCTAVGTVTKDLFAGGYAVLSWNVGVYRIKSNTLAATTFDVVLERGIWRPYTTSTNCTLYANQYSSVRGANIFTAAWGQSTVVGIPLINVTSGEYVWLQTWGPCVGMGVADQGGTDSERACYFWGDGAVINQTEEVAGPGQALQYAGEMLPYTADDDPTNAMIFFNLKISP